MIGKRGPGGGPPLREGQAPALRHRHVVLAGRAYVWSWQHSPGPAGWKRSYALVKI